MLDSASRKLGGLLECARVAAPYWQRFMGVADRQTLAAVGAAALIAAVALIFDAMTPQMIAVGILYVAIVLSGFWFPKPKAALTLALIATPLIIIGYWLTIPDNAPAGASGQEVGRSQSSTDRPSGSSTVRSCS